MQNSRRRFFYVTTALVATAPLYWTWKKLFAEDKRLIPGRMLGAAYQRGHNIFKMMFSKPSSSQQIGTVIIGGGISGLCAARQLKKKGYDDFLLLELEDHAGGNSRFGENKTGKFPLGAHYLPIPSPEFKELIALLQEIELITHIDEKGLPHYEERHLCHDPDERLFINGHWQEGLIPHFGVPKDEQVQIRKFITLMDTYKNAKGSDGKYAFDLPVDRSSADQVFRSLDKISMQQFLENNHLHSPYLHWYVSYCCKDDFGSTLEETSAWTGIHYFAGRRGAAGNANHEQVITWPEGNGWLAEKLLETSKEHLRSSCMVFEVHQNAEEKYEIDYMDYSDGSVKRMIAQNVIFSCPQFVQRHIKTNIKELKERTDAEFSYSTWVIVNAELDASKVAERNGTPLSWDNVIYGTQSLGYINSSNQKLERHKDRYNFTWYYLFPESGKVARKKVIKKTREEWVALMCTDMEKVYSGFSDWVLSSDVCVWGHAMIKPSVGFMWDGPRAKAAQSINGSLYFAHTDLSGMSLFEEGFMRGTEVANELLKATQHV